jgi:hypothetical protein
MLLFRRIDLAARFLNLSWEEGLPCWFSRAHGAPPERTLGREKQRD